MKRIHRSWLLVLLALVSASQSASAQIADQANEMAELAEFRVLASIKPLALIAQDLLGDRAEVGVLVEGAASPHDYALKVSDMRRLHDAHLLIWMGPELERFLEQAVAGLPPKRVLSLGKSQDSDDAGHRERGHQHDSDLHQWLDPRLAQDMARAIATRLQHLYPSAGTVIERRLAEQLSRYEQLHQDLKRTLTPVKKAGFVVQHRGYDHFVQRYDLQQVAWISRSPEQPPGVRHLYQLEKNLQARPPGEKASCLFVELAHQSASAHNLADQLQLKLQGLDSLGESASSYAALMRNLVGDLFSCLAAPP